MRKSLTSRFKSNQNANVFEITFHRLELYYYDLATNSKSFIELNYHKMNFSRGFVNECIFLFVFSRLKIRLSREKELKAITEFCVRCGRSHSRSRVAYRFSDKVTSKPVSALSRPDNWSATMDLTSTAGGSGSLPIPDLSPASVWVVPPPREIWYFQLNSPPGQTWVPLSFVPLIVQHLVNLHNLSWDHVGGCQITWRWGGRECHSAGDCTADWQLRMQCCDIIIVSWSKLYWSIRRIMQN